MRTSTSYNAMGLHGLLQEYIYFFTYSFLIDGRTSWTTDQLVTGLYLNTGEHKHRINIYTYQISMPCVGLEPTIPASKRAKTGRASDRSATVTGCNTIQQTLFVLCEISISHCPECRESCPSKRDFIPTFRRKILPLY
jgi:hypothetical protein